MNPKKMVVAGPTEPVVRKKFIPGRTIVYTFLPQVEPACNSRCTGCYILASGSFQNRVRRSEAEIIFELDRLTTEGYSVIPSTTEILLNRRYLDMLRAAKSECVLTNGKAVVGNQAILEELRSIGIKQVVVTANFSNSGLRLTESEFFKEAAALVLGAGLTLMLRITITPQNLGYLDNMVDGCVRLGANCIQFIRFMPISGAGKDNVLDEEGARKFFELLPGLRMRYPTIYISAGGSLGSQFRKKQFACGAGKSQFVIGSDNGVYPCIYLTQKENRLGWYANGELNLEREFDALGNPLECPAYRYFASLEEEKINKKLEVDLKC